MFESISHSFTYNLLLFFSLKLFTGTVINKIVFGKDFRKFNYFGANNSSLDSLCSLAVVNGMFTEDFRDNHCPYLYSLQTLVN